MRRTKEGQMSGLMARENLEIQISHEGSASDKYKKILLEQEYGIMDYGIEKILSQNECTSSESQFQEEDIMKENKIEVVYTSELSNLILSRSGQDQYTEQDISLHTTKKKNSDMDIETDIPETNIAARIKKKKNEDLHVLSPVPVSLE
ncbi:hypothetical protein C2G38_2216116 [Gigaspora rosea]|uniref:Uncharacterized protein n=1 Tax=Gigaspora rosea TaxID=44941 RepID=A0A397UDH9_9GLOM|nr:hypothetical protein C2G38_2216116 [Gigaspora rosea]